jgi:UDPglucose--hexose-1-phosphate uridylyltransferase
MGNWERRWHPLLEEWVILAAISGNRPWSGEIIEDQNCCRPPFDAACYLCPGVTRSSGIVNPVYVSPWVFTNDFSTFSFEAPNVCQDNIFEKAEPAHGINRVVCYSPWHNLTLAQLPIAVIEEVVSLWRSEYIRLSTVAGIKNVLIFENKGNVIGVSNAHPHCQIYSTNFVPRIVEKHTMVFAQYYKTHSAHLLCDLLQHELSVYKRIVYENEYFVAFIPFFARFVYETYIVPRRQVANIGRLSDDEMKALAEILKVLTVKFDNLYEMDFPNNTILFNAPTDGKPENELYHFHLEFYPPLRSRDKLKHVAGFDLGGGNIINAVMPEEAAQNLHDMSVCRFQ